MRKIGLIFIASFSAMATPALGQPSDAASADAVYAPFAVTQSSARAIRTISNFEIAGQSVSLNAYGRKARALRFDDARESDELRQLSGAFDPAARPAVVTFEMSVDF